jgi:hypothetical protein
MKGPVKPANVSVYVKLESVMLPPCSDLVQLPFGQVACASNCAAVGTGPEFSDGTVSFPFLGERLPVVVGAVWALDLTGTSMPPWLVQLTVAEYVVSSAPVAFELPTPASWYELHVTSCVEGSTEHVAAVPAEKWVPVGAFAGLIVVAADATAGNATAATTTVARARSRKGVLIFEFLLCIPSVAGLRAAASERLLTSSPLAAGANAI